MKLREGHLDPNLNDTRLMVSPGLIQNKLKNQKKKIVMISKRLDRQRLETQKMAKLVHHQINLMIKDQDASRKIFDDDTEKLGAKKIDSRGVKEDDVIRYLWAESCKHGRLASVSGEKACQYSTIFLRFDITLRSKMKELHAWSSQSRRSFAQCTQSNK